MSGKLALFNAVLKQLQHNHSGNDRKFKDIFSRSVAFATINFDKKEDLDFANYIYFDFLETIGVIEIIGTSSDRKWTYLGSDFYHSIKGRQYGISIGNFANQSAGVELFFSNLDIFPPAYETSHNEWDSGVFLKTVLELSIMYQEYKEKNLLRIGPFLDRYKFIEIYDPIYNQWLQVDKPCMKGLYRAGPQVYEKSFFIKNDDSFFSVKDGEWAYIFAQDLTSQGLINLRFIRESGVLVPWKFKLPSFLKRLLMASSEKVSFTKAGVEYSFIESRSAKEFLKTFGFIKESA